MQTGNVLPELVYTVSGVVADNQRRYNPRRFEIQAGNGAGHALALYPTPFGTQLGRGGGVRGTVRFDDTDKPAIWALLTLTVDLGIGGNLVFRAQTDAKGDFVLSMNRLPPLPQGVDHYAATLEIRALAAALPTAPIDPAALWNR